MVGFNKKIVFDIKGKILDYQTGYNDNYNKSISVYLPFMFNHKNLHTEAKLKIAINNTFPKIIIEVIGKKSETDLNKYTFDITSVYTNYLNNGLGLMQVEINCIDGEIFKSESFRGC